MELNIELEWRVNSHIEKQLSAHENDYLVAYFFDIETGIVDFLEQLKQHSSIPGTKGFVPGGV